MTIHVEDLQHLAFVFFLASCAAEPDQPAVAPLLEPAPRQQSASARPPVPPAEGLKPQQIARVVLEAQPEIKACYALSPSSAEGVSGSITISWEMAPSGEVIDIAVEQTQFADEGLGNCLVEKLKQLRYAATSNPTQASWTFEFRP
jgi:hypothetical protein